MANLTPCEEIVFMWCVGIVAIGILGWIGSWLMARKERRERRSDSSSLRVATLERIIFDKFIKKIWLIKGEKTK